MPDQNKTVEPSNINWDFWIKHVRKHGPADWVEDYDEAEGDFMGWFHKDGLPVSFEEFNETVRLPAINAGGFGNEKGM